MLFRSSLGAYLYAWDLGPHVAMERMVSMLVITCPCALGLATPLAISTALGRAARRGFIIKGGGVFEALSGIGAHGARPLLVFDKTGTLTAGEMRLTSWHGARAERGWVRAMERSSEHPVALALLEGIDPKEERGAPGSVREYAGEGLEGKFAGAQVLLGSPDFLSRRGVQINSAFSSVIDSEASLGRSIVVVARKGIARAVAAVGDRLRPEARGSLALLRSRGFRTALLSGDHSRVVSGVAEELGGFLEVKGGISPEGKLRYIEDKARTGPVIMVGDGINDAPALAAASVGIAVKGGAEASLRAADVYCRREGLKPVIELIDHSIGVLRTVRLGVGVSLFYNVVGATLAFNGLVGPLTAAVLMPCSSLTVLALAAGSRSFR